MRLSRNASGSATIALAISLAACSNTGVAPAAPRTVSPAGPAAASNGSEKPNFNLEVILRGEGFGHVKFRQPKDDEFIVYLDTWVRDLAPNSSYLLQRAVDTTVDGVCTSTGWLTLGKGPTPQAITTNDKGTGREELWRQFPPTPGAEFDIHFRVIHATTSAVVLTSECYQFVIRQ